MQEGKLLEHHETELCSPSHRFGPTVRIELGEDGGDVKLGGVKGDSQPSCDSLRVRGWSPYTVQYCGWR